MSAPSMQEEMAAIMASIHADVDAALGPDPDAVLTYRGPTSRADFSEQAVEERKAAARRKREQPAVQEHERTGRRLDYLSAADMAIDNIQFDDELVEGTIGKAAMAVLYGDSNSGKTFLAIDLAASIERGAGWMGRNTDDGIVVYLATEAAASVLLRAGAYRRRHGAKLLQGLVIVQSPINLFDGQADVHAVLDLVGELEQLHGRKCVLIIGDTLARIAAGANENSGEDMGVVLKNADAIREATQATFLWVHHTGKDAAKGMRGWSGMRAAIDTEIEVTADDATGQRVAEITKQRDLPGKGERIGFRLDGVPMGVNRWGTERSSAVVVPDLAPPKARRGGRIGEVAGAIVELLTTHGTGMKKGDIVKHFADRYERATVYRELKKMTDAERIYQVAGVCALLRHRRPP